MRFFKYPKNSLPQLTNYFLLDLDGKPLSREDKHLGIFLIDSTWNYTKVMARSVKQPLITRSLPAHIKTTYPRRNTRCSDPERGLSSIEALFVAYTILERDTTGLFDNYHWKDAFLSQLLVELDSDFKKSECEKENEHCFSAGK